MKKLKSYTSIWSVEKVIYAINDFKLPFPITFSQMAWFVGSLFLVMMLSDLPPLSFIDGALLKYIGIPVGITWFMSQKTFDGKKPYRFIQTLLIYFLRPKVTFAYKEIKFKKEKMTEYATSVRSELIELSH
ncbi:TPA: conjugal transfer protein [Listeria monocytogenes]|nr:conjugal transfer protein [Listeria monocytogenes]HAA9071019.1 conjugal transfer protein [Listeria monocytogenes]HDI4828572.1 conjugal transfer protein [Listeria monocytogenes]HDM9928153.1 conjugal transfer protein [Listeria monocytogenes]